MTPKPFSVLRDTIDRRFWRFRMKIHLGITRAAILPIFTATGLFIDRKRFVIFQRASVEKQARSHRLLIASAAIVIPLGVISARVSGERISEIKMRRKALPVMVFNEFSIRAGLGRLDKKAISAASRIDNLPLYHVTESISSTTRGIQESGVNSRI